MSGVSMQYQTVLVEQQANSLFITFNRVAKRNSLNRQLIDELHHLLNEIEKTPIKMIILRGQQGIFCSGMDLSEIKTSIAEISAWSQQFMLLLKRIALIPKIVIALVDGKAMAGGLGIISACDYVIATHESSFSLSEALWGLVPANILPYLIRRIGFQNAYRMTITCEKIIAEKALSMQLIDDLSNDLDQSLQQISLRFSRLTEQTVHDIKYYFRQLWLINEEVENKGVDELTRLLGQTTVQSNIKRFVEEGKLPWEHNIE